jgi:RNA polymerase sigma-70 factor (ECF subfamily)
MPLPIDAPAGAGTTSAADARLDVVTIHQRHAEFVWLSLQRLGIRDADIEDLLQEVFVVVHRRLPSFDGSSRMTTWLFGICIRIAAAYRRRAHRRHEESMARIPEPASGDEPNPEESAAARQARARLLAVLDAMDLEKRALFVMFELDEMRCEDIADLLGIPLGTVYSRLHAARKGFEQALSRVEARQSSDRQRRRGGRQ